MIQGTVSIIAAILTIASFVISIPTKVNERKRAFKIIGVVSLGVCIYSSVMWCLSRNLQKSMVGTWTDKFNFDRIEFMENDRLSRGDGDSSIIFNKKTYDRFEASYTIDFDKQIVFSNSYTNEKNDYVLMKDCDSVIFIQNLKFKKK